MPTNPRSLAAPTLASQSTCAKPENGGWWSKQQVRPRVSPSCVRSSVGVAMRPCNGRTIAVDM
eukprot:6180928-Pleurochrysis_carterae.AAC.1